MDAARSVLDRLARVEALARAEAPPEVLLSELECLLGEAERWAHDEGGESAHRAVAQLRTVLTRDMIAV